jgi:hypothetical protein
MAKNLEKEYQYYLEHQQELADQHSGKVLVIKGQQVIGVFDSDFEAVRATSSQHELGTFLVQRCEAPGKTPKQTFHSRVAFN